MSGIWIIDSLIESGLSNNGSYSRKFEGTSCYSETSSGNIVYSEGLILLLGPFKKMVLGKENSIITMKDLEKW